MGLVGGFEAAFMEERNDCGPVALLQALRCARVAMGLQELKRVWGWTGSDFLDTPWAHARAMRRLGVGFSMRGGWRAEHVLSELHEGRPVVLLVRRGLLRFHWVAACGEEEGSVLVSTGTGIESYGTERLDRELARGLLPFLLGCRRFGYVLGKGDGKCPLYARVLGRGSFHVFC